MTTKPFIKNWKTTALGLGAALLAAYEVAIQGGCSFADWSCWGQPIVFAAIGFFARDADKTSEQSK